MSDKQKIVRIFIGSPGGLKDERRAAHDVVNSVNRNHSDRWRLQFKLLGWEDAVPGYVRAQSKINDDLDKCDYFIGVLCDNWGSKTGPDYSSGFEEEYFRPKGRIETGLMKDMAIYFKMVEVPPNMKPGEGLGKVLEFRQKCIDENKIFFKDFADHQVFRDTVRDKLEEIGWRETEIVTAEDPQLSQPRNTPSIQDKSSDPPTSDSWLIDQGARDFLHGLMQRRPNWESTSAHEVARLRLIGTAVSRSGNDEFYVGNHDANLIFQEFRNAALSKQEVRALVDSGVVGFQYQNVPLWRWLARYEDEGSIWSRVEVLAAVGSESEQRYAIEILDLGSQSIPLLHQYFDQKRVLASWLSDATSSQVFDAAVSFLGSNATDGDLPLIEEAAAQCSPQRRTKVEEAIVSILSRTNLDGALKRVVEKEVDKVGQKLADVLFSNSQSLATETVLSCLAAKSESIRLHAVQLLFARNEITLEAAETLLTDSNHEIRLLAAETLKKNGVKLDDDVAKQALCITKPSNRLIGLFSGRETDDTYYEIYRVNRLLELDFSALRSKANSAGVFSERELSVLYSRFASKFSDEIRQNLKDRFKGYFNRKIDEERNAGTIVAGQEPKIRNLENFMLKRFCNDALVALCGLAKAQDLDLVRDVIKDTEIDATEGILKYLARFGDWSDIERIRKLGDYPIGRPTGLLEFYQTKLPSQKAATILTLGKGRVADLLALDLDSEIRMSLAKQLPRKVFIDLRDEVLLRELGRKDDEYRVVFALRCVLALPKSRVTRLLDRYVDRAEHRFYNSVHWLDLGASLPIPLVKNIAERALAGH